MKQFIFDKKYQPIRIFLGFVLGIAAGMLFHDFSIAIKPLGTIFMNLIKMLIVPIILFSVASGIASIGDAQKLRRIGGKVVLIYCVMTVIACVAAVGVSQITHPGIGFTLQGLEAFDASKVTTPSFLNFFIDMVPDNIVSAMAKSNIMQLIFFTFILGVAIVHLGEKANVFTQFLDQGAQITYRMLDIIMIYAPVGIFALMANTVAVYGPQLFGALGKFVFTDYLACIVTWLLMSFAVKAYTGIHYGKMCGAMVPIWINTLSTTSSAGTIPITMDVTTNKMKVPSSLASFSIPLGATINLTGAAIYKTVLAFFVAQIYGLDFTFMQIVMIITISTIMSIAAPGIPGGGIVTGAIFLNLLGLPMDMMGPIAGMYRLIDMAHTTLNVSGDVMGTLLVAKNENLWTADEFNGSGDADPDAAV